VVYVGSNNGAIYALNASTGAELWSYKNGLPLQPSVANGMLFLGENELGEIEAFGLP
jgi:outer membrane protein assembly factor BamB